MVANKLPPYPSFLITAMVKSASQKGFPTSEVFSSFSNSCKKTLARLLLFVGCTGRLCRFAAVH